MNIPRSTPIKLIATCILLATAFSCSNLKEERQAAQTAGGPFHATEVSVSLEKSDFNPASRNLHLTFSGIPTMLNIRAEDNAALAAIYFLTALRPAKRPSFDSIVITLKKTMPKTEAVTHTYAIEDIKRSVELFDDVVRPFNRNMENLEILKSFSDSTRFPDSVIHSIQQYVRSVESIRGKSVATLFNGFSIRSDSVTGKPILIITCDNRGIKHERITYCKFIFLQDANKIIGERIWEVDDSDVPGIHEQESEMAK